MRASDFSLSFFLSLGSLGLPRFHGLFAFKPRPSFQSNFLVLSGAEIAQGGVSSSGVVQAFGILEDFRPHHLAVGP